MAKVTKEDLKKVIDAIIEKSGYTMLDISKSRLKDRTSIFKEILRNYFEKKEGRGCCADKASYTAKLVEKTLQDGKYYPLRETYREYQAKGGDIGGIKELDEVAYWCPVTLETTEEALIVINCVISGGGHGN